MDDFGILQKVSRSEKSICGKCSHRRVCLAIENQPCFECNQFVEEIIYCKDCKKKRDEHGYLWCLKWDEQVQETDFCSYGERKVYDGNA